MPIDTERCATCVHWGANESNADWGLCAVIFDEPRALDVDKAMIDHDAPAPGDPVPNAYLWTRPDFGCVLWSNLP